MSAIRLAGFTAGGESHPAPKTLGLQLQLSYHMAFLASSRQKQNRSFPAHVQYMAASHAEKRFHAVSELL